MFLPRSACCVWNHSIKNLLGTDEFVGKLFEALNNKTYLAAAVDNNSGTAQTKASESTETVKKEESDSTKTDSKTKVLHIRSKVLDFSLIYFIE